MFYDIDFKRKNKLYITLKTKHCFKETGPFTSEIGQAVVSCSDAEGCSEASIPMFC